MADAIPFHYGRHKNVQKEPIPFQTNAFATNASGSAVVTFDYPSNKSAGIAIHAIQWAFGAAATAPTITIQDGDAILTWGPFHLPVAVGFATIQFDPPLLFTPLDADSDQPTTLVITLAGGAVQTDLYVIAAQDGTELY
jgi:hypothetical protein